MTTEKLLEPYEWADRGACKGLDVSIFFAEIGERYVEAKKVCAVCPVFHECREWAIAHESDGFWGGTNERQRRKIRLERQIQYRKPFFRSECGTEQGYQRHYWLQKTQGVANRCQACLKAHVEHNA